MSRHCSPAHRKEFAWPWKVWTNSNGFVRPAVRGGCSRPAGRRPVAVQPGRARMAEACNEPRAAAPRSRQRQDRLVESRTCAYRTGAPVSQRGAGQGRGRLRAGGRTRPVPRHAAADLRPGVPAPAQRDPRGGVELLPDQTATAWSAGGRRDLHDARKVQPRGNQLAGRSTS